MRVAFALMIVPLLGCSESDPEFAVSQWDDGVEKILPTVQGLHADVGAGAPGLWERSSAQAEEGDQSWHFGDGVTFPSLSNAALLTPDFEAGRRSFLRFAYWVDVPTLSPDTGKDGLVVEGQIEDEDWVQLELNGGYPYILDPVTLGSSIPLSNGIIAGTGREWVDDYVELPDAEIEQEIRFRFRFGADIDDADNMGEGIYIDDVEFLIVE